MSISKKVTYIPNSLYQSATDGIRQELGAYWKNHKKSLKFSKGTKMVYVADYPEAASVRGKKPISDFAFSEEIDINETELPTKRVSIRLYGNPQVFENQRHWRAYVKGGSYKNAVYTAILQLDTDFKDHVFTCDVPLSQKEAEGFGGSGMVKTYDISLEYNFYQREYEKLLRSKWSERILPNLYTYYSYKEEVDDEQIITNKLFENHVMLGGRLDKNTANKFTDRGAKNPKVSNSDEYLNSFAKALTNRSRDNRDTNALRPVIDAYKNVMLPASNMSILGYNTKKEMFPMWGELTFATDKTTQFTQILLDANASCIFMKDIEQSIRGSQLPNVAKEYRTHYELPVEVKNELGTTSVTTIGRVGTSSARLWNINDWIRHFRSTDPMPLGSSITLGKQNKEVQLANQNNYGFYKKMMEMILVGKIRTLIKSQQRRFADIIDGDSAYSEEVFYKVTKHEGDPGAGEPLQTFWIPNTNEIDVINFIDTQVKYNKFYTYRVTAYKLVIGASYRYINPSITKRVTQDCVEFVDNKGESVAPRVPGSVTVSNVSGVRTAIQVQGDDRFMAEYDVVITPEVYLVEVPFFQTTSQLIDDPPLAPEVDILPYRNDSRFLKLFMQGTTGEQKLYPIILNDKDKQMVKNIRAAKNLGANDPITYKADDYPSFFEIYRVEQPPVSYTSFGSKQRAIIRTDVSAKTSQKAASAAYVEQISPNKKYYYMFRSIDVHGKTGYPSPVYEVEMVEDKGAFYPLVQVYEMTGKKEVETIKPAQRFIQIMPNIGQTLINESKSGFEDYTTGKDIKGNLTYGYKEDSIWDKRFKIRLTSRKTGRKLDFNVRFKTKRVKTDFEESS